MKKLKAKYTYPVLLIWYDKHGDRFYLALDEAGLHRSALRVLSERLDERYIEEGPEHIRLDNIVTNGEGEKALQVLYARSKHEYEGFEVMHVEVP